MSVTREDLESDDADRIRLRGKWSPGLAVVAGASEPRNWEEVKGYGISGASLRYTGDSLAKFTVEIRLWEPSHFEAWATWKDLVAKPRRGVRPKAMRIEHPALSDLGISDVVVEDRTQLTQVENGVWSTTISFKQYRKPLPMLLKPNGAIPTDPLNPTAKDSADLEIERLRGAVKDLQAEDARR